MAGTPNRAKQIGHIQPVRRLDHFWPRELADDWGGPRKWDSWL